MKKKRFENLEIHPPSEKTKPEITGISKKTFIGRLFGFKRRLEFEEDAMPLTDLDEEKTVTNTSAPTPQKQQPQNDPPSLSQQDDSNAFFDETDPEDGTTWNGKIVLAIRPEKEEKEYGRKDSLAEKGHPQEALLSYRGR